MTDVQAAPETNGSPGPTGRQGRGTGVDRAPARLREGPHRSRWTQLAVWVGLAAVLLHTGIIATWVGPQTPVRMAVGNEALRAYVVPVFEQSWMIFAPTPRRVAVNLEVRAEYIDPATGQPVITDWFDLVDLEDALIEGNPFPPRMSLASRRVANTLNAVMDDLNETQIELVAENYLTTPVDVLGNRMVDVGDDSVPAGTVGRYVTYEAAAVRLASLYYTVILEEAELTYVQFRTGSRYVPTWEPGAPRGIDDAEVTWRDYGWRPATPLSSDEVDSFVSYIDAAGDLR